MDPELEQYKKNAISQLTKVFNIEISLLTNKLNSDISHINRLRITNASKRQRINSLRNIYFSNVNNVKAKYVSDVRIINLLTEIPGKPKSSKKALLVGINYKGSGPYELYGCINDTNNIKALLEEKYSFKNFVFLTDDTNKQPTKENIIGELTNLLVNAVSGDSLFFLFSGHGTRTIDLNKDELDGRDEVIVPMDGLLNPKSRILDDELNQIIQTNLKPGVKLFTLIDSCFSGTVLDLKYNYLDSSNLGKLTTNPNVTETKGHVIMISGCMDTQTSADAYLNYNGQNINSGAMTFSFLETIRQLGTDINLQTLIGNMRTILKKNSYSQIPQLSSGNLINIATTGLRL
jgi:hypothetical protein